MRSSQRDLVVTEKVEPTNEVICKKLKTHGRKLDGRELDDDEILVPKIIIKKKQIKLFKDVASHKKILEKMDCTLSAMKFEHNKLFKNVASVKRSQKEVACNLGSMKHELTKLCMVRDGLLKKESFIEDRYMNQAVLNKETTEILEMCDTLDVDMSQNITKDSLVMITISDNPEHIGKQSVVFDTTWNDNIVKRLLHIDGKEIWYDDKSLLVIPRDLPIIDRPSFYFHSNEKVEIIKSTNSEHVGMQVLIQEVKPQMLLCRFNIKGNSYWYHKSCLKLVK